MRIFHCKLQHVEDAESQEYVLGSGSLGWRVIELLFPTLISKNGLLETGFGLLDDRLVSGLG